MDLSEFPITWLQQPRLQALLLGQRGARGVVRDVSPRSFPSSHAPPVFSRRHATAPEDEAVVVKQLEQNTKQYFFQKRYKMVTNQRATLQSNCPITVNLTDASCAMAGKFTFCKYMY